MSHVPHELHEEFPASDEALEKQRLRLKDEIAAMCSPLPETPVPEPLLFGPDVKARAVPVRRRGLPSSRSALPTLQSCPHRAFQR